MNRSKPDGLTAGPHYTSLVMKELAGVDVPGFDVNELIIVGAPTLVDDDYLLCVDRNLAKSWDEVMKMGRPLRYAAQRPGIGRMPMGAEFMQLVGGPLKVIYGYKSTAEELAAFARGETEIVTCIVPPAAADVSRAHRTKEAGSAGLVERGAERRVDRAPRGREAAPYPRPARRQDHRLAEAGVQHGREHPPVPEGLHAAAQDAQAHRGHLAQGVQGHHRGSEFVKAAKIANYEVGYGSPEQYEKQLATIQDLPPDGALFFQKPDGRER